MKNHGIIFIKIIVIISLPISILFTSLHIATNDLNFFQEKYNEYNISKVTGMSSEGLMDVTVELLDYLSGERDNMVIYEEVNGQNRQVFGERELMHLNDVQLLFNKSYMIRNICIIVALVSIIYLFIYNKKALSKSLIYSALIPTGVLIILGAIISIDFYNAFTIFHKILFTNDLWLLNPKTEILIQMYPMDFFEGIALRILTYFIIGLIVSACVGILIKHRFKDS